MGRAPNKPAGKRQAAPQRRAAAVRPSAPKPLPVLAPPPEPPRRPKVSLPAIESSSTQLRKVVLNIAFVLAILIFIPILASQFLRDQVRIEPVAVPTALVKRGMTGEVLASRLWDGLADATALAGTSKASVDAVPNSQRVEFSVPEIGLSLDSIVRQTRQFFNMPQTRISGEMVCADASCAPEALRLRIRVLRASAEVIDLPPVGTQDLRTYFRDAGVQILERLDPYVAVAALSTAEPVRAIAQARRLVRQHHPDSKWAYMITGNILSEQFADDRGAVAEYQSALAIDPGFVIAQSNMAGALRRLGDPAAARKLYDQIAKAHPEMAKPIEGYAELAMGAGELDQSIALFQQAAAIDPGNAYYFSRIGDIAYGQGKLDEARDWYGKALDIDPAYPLALEKMFMQHVLAGDIEPATQMLRNAADHAPDSALVQQFLGLVLSLQSDYEGALAAYQRSLAAEPDDPAILFEVGKALQGLNRQEESVITLTRAIELDPYNPAPLMSRGTALALLGQSAQAKADFERIIAVDTTGLYAPQAQTFLGILDDLAKAAEASP